MCTIYRPSSREVLTNEFGAKIVSIDGWSEDVWQDYSEPIFRLNAIGGREVLSANYGFVPKIKMPDGVKRYCTTNS